MPQQIQSLTFAVHTKSGFPKLITPSFLHYLTVYYTKYGIHDPIYEGETVDFNSDSEKTLLQVEVGWNTQDSDKEGCYTKVTIDETEHTCKSCSLCMESASVSADCSNIPNGRAVECMKLQKYESNENDVWFPLTAEALPAQDSDDSSGEESRCRLFCFLDK